MMMDTADLTTGEWRVLEQLAREAGKLLRSEHIPDRLVERGLVVADGCCWKLTKAGWCRVMFKAEADICPLAAIERPA